MARTTFSQWYGSLPIPWLVAGVNGQLEANSWPAVLDQQAVLLDAARKVAFPTLTPSDALPNLGGDRNLIQGASETNQNFALRVRAAWNQWAWAGTHLGLLIQLYYYGYTNAVLVQQNGLAFSLTGAPAYNGDPSQQLLITDLGPNPSFNPPPQHTILLTVSTGGALGTAVFGITVDGVFIGNAGTSGAIANECSFFVPGTNTWIYAGAGNYVLNSTYTINANTGAITRGGGAINTVTQNSAPWWSFDTNNRPYGSLYMILIPGSVVVSQSDLNNVSLMKYRFGRASQTCVGMLVYNVGAGFGWPLQFWGDGTNWGGDTTTLYPLL